MMPRKKENARTVQMYPRKFNLGALKQNQGIPVRQLCDLPVSFTVPGRPVPAGGRGRQNSRKVRNKTVRYIAYKDTVGDQAREVVKGIMLGPVIVELAIYLEDYELMDIDNVEKTILDGMKDIVYLDDRQVVEMHSYKLQGDPERVEITVWPIAQKGM